MMRKTTRHGRAILLLSLPLVAALAITVSPSVYQILPSSAASTSSQCQRHAEGDADCDGTVDISDFERFRKEYIGADTTRTTDFDEDSLITVQDFEIWRRGYFGDGVSSSPIPAGNTYYVGPAGNDASAGTRSAPFKTIAKGISRAAAGDEIHVLSGTYSEKLSIKSKNGSAGKPIVIVGDSPDPSSYPVLDGGDAASGAAADWSASTPAVSVTGSSWIAFERLRIRNSSPAAISIDSSNYIIVRRNIIDYHKYAVLNRNDSNHILIEYNDIYQSYGDRPWSTIKGSKWEGGAYTSFGGGSVTTVRYNYIHDSFNGVYIFRNTRTGPYMDANVWIYRNRFERILDDPYEPDVSYAFNNHFFENTLVNTHRMVSMASGSSTLPDKNLGPIYVYDNVQVTTYDITHEAASRDSYNSALKVELNVNWFANGVYIFNNSIDIAQPVNGVGVHILNGDNTVHNWHHFNNAYRTKNGTYTKNPLLKDSDSDYNISSKPLPDSETHSLGNTDPGFTDPTHELFTLTEGSASRGKAREASFSTGFAAPVVVPAGADMGAFAYGETDFRKTPAPTYEVPPGGENALFGHNEPWPADLRKGVNPPSGRQ